MCDIKTEPENAVCRGCLSSDRRLSPITNYDLYWSLLKDDQKLQACHTPEMALCWECTAVLRRMQSFRAQVQRAFVTLQGLAFTLPKFTLSTLAVHHKKEYDDIFKENELQENSQIKIPENNRYKEETTDMNIAIKLEEEGKYYVETNDSLNNDSDHHSIDNDNEYASEGDDNDSNADYEDYFISENNRSSKRLAAKKCPQGEYFDVPLESLVVLPTKVKKKKRKSSTAFSDDETERKDPIVAKLEQELIRIVEKKNPKQTKKKKVVEKIQNTNKDDKLDWDPENLFATEFTSYIKEKYRVKPDSDPEFRPGDEIDDDQRKGGQNDEQNDGNDEEQEKQHGRRDKRKARLYKKLVIKYSETTEVLPYFTEVEMSEEEIVNTLKREDAIVHEKRKMKCKVCGRCFTYRRTLEKHKKLAHNKKTTKPPQDPEPPPTLWQCSVCPRMFRRQHMVAHMDECHRNQYLCNNQSCEWSSKVFWSRDDFYEHWTECHHTLVCDVCGHHSRSTTTLTWHMQEKHIRARTVACAVCGHTYSTRSSLKQHMELQHAPPEPPELRYCVECDVTFRNVAVYKSHVSNVHRPKPRFPCAACGKVLANRTSYENHFALYHGGGRTPHQCHICGKYLCKKQSLLTHLDSHNNVKKPKTKPCTVCGKMFSNNRTLRFHMYTHTGERPYKCAHCDAAFTQPYCLSMHLNKTHGIVMKIADIRPADTEPVV